MYAKKKNCVKAYSENEGLRRNTQKCLFFTQYQIMKLILSSVTPLIFKKKTSFLKTPISRNTYVLLALKQMTEIL